MKLRCPFCREAFPWESRLPWPKVCPCCAEEIGIPDRGDNGVVMPFIRSAKMAATDKTYRDIEAGSDVRVEKAAELTGSTKEEMAALKITDMNDSMRAGDIADKTAATAMENLKAMSKTPVGFIDNGSGYSDGVSTGAINVNGKIITGIEPNAGARAAARVQRRMQGM